MTDLLPYVPRPALDWARRLGSDDDGPRWQVLEGTMVFGDVSGFTKMSERLARHGKVGAEEVTGAINTCFGQLLEVAYGLGGSLLKFGGDALLLFFGGDDHARRAARAAIAMRARLRTVGRLHTTAGQVTLRISIGVHSGAFHVFLVGGSHREFVVAGPGASATVAAEGLAAAGQIVMSAAAAAALPASWRGPGLGDGYLLRADAGPIPSGAVPPADGVVLDVGRLVPRAIRAHLEEGGRHPEHRLATVAFLHFDGTDAILEHHGPEETATRLDSLVRTVQESADEHRVTFLGTDIDHDGGKIIMVSGVPSRVGDDEERLLSALRQVADAGPPLSLRIGAHSGPVFSGDVGPAYRRTFTVMGDTVNLAARVMAKAQPGQVLVTPDLVERSSLAFETTAVEPFFVKGKRRPVTALVLGPPRRARDVRTRSLPFVGRQDEWAQLTGDLDAVRAGAIRLVELVGEHGIGKSRLVEELRGAAGELRWMTIVCEEYEAATPYAPFRVLARHLLDVDVEADRAALATRLRARLEEAPELVTSLPLLGTVLGLDLPDTPETAALAPEFRRARTDEASAEFLCRLLPDPVVVVFEDAQHMDDASRGLLDRLVTALGDTAALVVVTRRDTGSPVFDVDETPVQVLALAPLTPDQSARSLLLATEDAPILPEDVRTLSERSMGNPLFLDELLAALRAGAVSDSLPASVDAAVTAEIDRLAPRLRHILQCAAVLGQAFTEGELAELLRAEGRDLDASARRGLEPFLAADGSGMVRFRSTTTRDCAYEELPYRRRRELHAQAAQALTGHGDAEAELLSMHCLHAQRFDEAWRYALAAGYRARDSYANVEAGVLFERALAAARRLPRLDRGEVAGVWEALGDVRERAGRFQAAARAFRQARRLLADVPVAHAGLCLKEAWIAERVGRHSEAVRWIRRGLTVLDGVPGTEAGRTRAQLSVWYAAIRQAQGKHREAVAWCEIAITAAQASGDREAEAHALFILDWAWVSLGRSDLATHSPRALALYVELGDLGGEAVVLNNLGGFAYFSGRWDEALSYYERGRDARLRTGNDIDAATGTCNIGEVLSDQGRYDEAEPYLRDALRVWRAAGYRPGIGYARCLLGRLWARTGRFAEAHDEFDAARRHYTDAGLAADVRFVDIRLAECLVLEGRAAEALELVDTAARDSAAADTGGDDEALVARVRGRARWLLGDLPGARAALEAGRDAARARQADYEIALTDVALAPVLRALGDEASATATERAGRGVLDRLGVVAGVDSPG